ncbi:MAG TPA: HAMP domain-containing sensor histidine kinase [Steroidobacteraceae bacterium]|nr:HAMP domain-containing sensor histidine kinase [Steroidobacteraceae bacterium]
MIAHELRSPLAVMSNVLRVCRASIVPKGMPAAEDVLNRQVNRALRLVNDLMDLTRVSEQPLRLDPGPVDLGRVALNAVEDLEQEIQAREQALVLELAAEAVWVRGDAARLEQIVGNLLENSSKYSPDGARITLSLAREEDRAVLRVRDEGAGISAEDLQHIFEPYFRGGGSAHAGRDGLGLGLTLTRRLVQMHGGTIEAKSPGAGCGSEFTVRLPIAAG